MKTIDEDGMVTCNICKGKKYLSVDKGYYNKYVDVNIGGFLLRKPVCSLCKGTGKITWIEQAFSTKTNEEVDDTLRNFNLWFDFIMMGNGKITKRKTWKHWSDKSKRVS